MNSSFVWFFLQCHENLSSMTRIYDETLYSSFDFVKTMRNRQPVAAEKDIVGLKTMSTGAQV